jgi:chemosensory pili system protein ChpC
MSNGSVRSLLLQVTGGQLLVPSAVVAEVVTYREPEQSGAAFPWLHGVMRWRGQSLPVLSLEHLLGIPVKDAKTHVRIVVLYGIYHPEQIPFYALLAKGMPSSVTINPASLHSAKAIKRPGVTASANIEERTVWLPDFVYLEKLLLEKLEKLVG